MQTIVVKWGNSHGIRLPKAFLKSVNIVENDPVDITLDNEKIIIKKMEIKKRKKLEQRLFEFYGENFDQIVRPQKEYDWGKLVGKEIW
jgi:antitoxin MazE